MSTELKISKHRIRLDQVIEIFYCHDHTHRGRKQLQVRYDENNKTLTYLKEFIFMYQIHIP